MGDNVGSIYNNEVSICSNIFIYLFYIAVCALASLSIAQCHMCKTEVI